MPTSGGARLTAAVLLLLSSLVAARATADDAFELDWDADDGCPAQEDARRMLDEYLGDAGDTQQFGEDARIEVHIEQGEDGRYHAEVVVEGDDERGERAFVGASCRDVAEAAALIAAMLLDPAGVAARSAARAPEPAASRGPAGAQLALGVHLLGDLGSLPGPTAGGGLVVGIRSGRLHAGLRLSATLPRRTEQVPVAASGDAGGELALYAAALRGGFELVRGQGGHVGTGPSAGLEAGVAVGRGWGSGLERRGTDTQLWTAPSLGWALLVSVEQLAFGLFVEALAPLHRPSWVLEGYGELFRAPALVGRVSLDVAWLLPWP
jgi:hypothetical protein